METKPSTKALTEEVTGISKPKAVAFWLTANAVATPSTVVFLSKVSLQPSDKPKTKLRDLSELQVRLRSPKPDRPDNVFSLAQCAFEKATISEKPRAMSAALALSPCLAPIATPHAIAIIFFSAPPSSTPTTSDVR